MEWILADLAPSGITGLFRGGSYFILMAVLCYLITLVLEFAVGFLFRLRDKESYFIIFLVNTITNPVVVACSFVCNLFMDVFMANRSLLLMEIVVVIVEALLYRAKLKNLRHPWLFSIAANLASFFLGTFLLAML